MRSVTQARWILHRVRADLQLQPLLFNRLTAAKIHHLTLPQRIDA